MRNRAEAGEGCEQEIFYTRDNPDFITSSPSSNADREESRKFQRNREVNIITDSDYKNISLHHHQITTQHNHHNNKNIYIELNSKPAELPFYLLTWILF